MTCSFVKESRHLKWLHPSSRPSGSVQSSHLWVQAGKGGMKQAPRRKILVNSTERFDWRWQSKYNLWMNKHRLEEDQVTPALSAFKGQRPPTTAVTNIIRRSCELYLIILSRLSKTNSPAGDALWRHCAPPIARCRLSCMPSLKW